LDLTLQCHCRVSRVRAVWHWRGVPPACRVRRVSPANGVTGAKRAPWETRVYQVDYHETILSRREKTKDKALKKKRSCPPSYSSWNYSPTKIRDPSYIPLIASLYPHAFARKIQKLRNSCNLSQNDS